MLLQHVFAAPPAPKQHPRLRPHQRTQQWHGRGKSYRPVAAQALREGEPSSRGYEWSWNELDRGRPLDGPSAFDDSHPLPDGAPNSKALVELVQSAASSSTPPSQRWMESWCTASLQALPESTVLELVGMATALAALGYTPPEPWIAQLCTAVCAQAGGPALGELPPRALVDLVWALASFGHTCSRDGLAAQLLRAAHPRLGDMMGSDLARLACAVGSLVSAGSTATGSALQVSPALSALHGGAVQEDAATYLGLPSGALPALLLPAGFLDAVLGEAEFQLVEFASDFSAMDLARLASGLADLLASEGGANSSGSGGISAAGVDGSSTAPVLSPRLVEALQMAVYSATRTLPEKAAVDYALAKLAGAGARRSMHFDPRWTHEELKWLPRHERDKQRILRDGWYRTKWTGWSRTSP